MDAYTLTKIDIAALRKADGLIVAFNRPGDLRKPRVEAFKRAPAPSASNPYPQEGRHSIPCKVSVQYDHEVDHGGVECWSHVNLYASQHCDGSSVLATLRAGDEIEFRFWPDAYTSDTAARAGLHGDIVNLLVHRGGRHAATFLWEVSFCPDNTARMCKHAPFPKRLLQSA
jgi:hypothetical protein